MRRPSLKIQYLIRERVRTFIVSIYVAYTVHMRGLHYLQLPWEGQAGLLGEYWSMDHICGNTFPETTLEFRLWPRSSQH